MSDDQAALRILCACADVERVREAAHHAFRSGSVEEITAESIRRLSPAHALVVDLPDQARMARATGFDGAIVVVAEPESADEVSGFLAQGTHFSPPLGGTEALVEVLRNALPVNSSGQAIPVEPAVIRMRRLIASGELAGALRHAFNNPLTALMAEIQLLQMEARDDDTRAAATRMIELVRRLTEMSRTLESVRDR